jgi:tetratricopeptide (TPR) repeat protein
MWDLVRARQSHQRALRLWRAGRHARALACVERAAGRFARCGARAERTAALLTRADFLVRLARYAEAEAALVEAVGSGADVVPDDTMIKLGDVQRLRGRYATAEATLSEIAARSAAADNALGVVYKDTGRYELAAARYASALHAAGPADRDLRASIHHNLAGLAHARGEFAAAEAPARAALALREEERGPHAPQTAADAAVLGAVLVALRRFDEAERHLRRAYAIWTGRFGPDHYEAGVCLHTLGVLEHRRGRSELALPVLMEALRIKATALGTRHPDVAAVLNNLAVLHADRGRTAEAAQHYRTALAILDATLGPAHPRTVRCRANAANAILDSPRPWRGHGNPRSGRTGSPRHAASAA